MRKLCAIAAALLLSVQLWGCGAPDPIPAETDLPATEQITEAAETVAEGYDLLGDTLWKVGGVASDGKLVDVRDYPPFADLYDSEFLSFKEDGTFFYVNLFAEEGTYEPFKDGFLLRTTKHLKFDSEQKQYVENPIQPEKKYAYYLTVLDENTFAWAPYDAMLDQITSDWLFFVRNDAESAYIAANKYTKVG